MITATITLQKPDKSPLWARMTVDTGTLTIDGTPTFAIFNSAGTSVLSGNVSGQTAGAAATVEAWYNLDSTLLTDGEYHGRINLSATASADSLQRTETYEFLILVQPAVPTEASATDLARQEIIDNAEAESFPVLTARQIEYCLMAAKRQDADGYLPTDTDWTPTFDTAAGIAMAWRLKAGKAASKYDFSSDNQKLSRSQIHKQCLEMAAMWEEQMDVQSGQIVTYEDINVNADDYDPRYGLSNVRLF